MHYVCFSNSELLVLLTGVEIEKFICFESDYEEKLTQEEYNQAVFSLCKRGILITFGKDNFRIAEAFIPMLQTLKKAEYLIQIKRMDIDFPEYNIYLSSGNSVVATMGTRENEYIKMSFLNRKELESFILNSDVLPNDYTENLSNIDINEILSMEDEVIDSLKEEGFVTEKDFENLEGLKALISIRLVKDIQEYKNLGIVWNPVQDRLIISSRTKNEYIYYSKKYINNFLNQLMEEKYDIS